MWHTFAPAFQASYQGPGNEVGHDRCSAAQVDATHLHARLPPAPQPKAPQK